VSGSAAVGRAVRSGGGWPVLLLVWAASAVYVAGFVDRGWIPHDEGTIGQSAERVLGGELPHRDYDEGYTGGLTFLHAAAFRLAGIRLLSLRYVLFVFFLLFLAAVYAIAVRIGAPPWLAGLLTLLAVGWSVPNYFASLPSWYNLFFATFGVLAVMRHIETGRRIWLFIAGLCAAVSVLFKVVGFYDAVAVILFLAYREQVLASARSEEDRRSLAFLLCKAVGAAIFVASLILLFGGRDPMHAVYFVLPGAAIVSWIVVSEWRRGRGGWVERWKGLGGLLMPFLIGLILPLALFAVPYLRTGSLSELVRGVFVQPSKQIRTVRMALPPASALLPAIPYALLLALSPVIPRRSQRVLAIVLALPLAVALFLASSPETYRTIWNSARPLAVAAVLVGCGFLIRSTESPALTDRKQQEIFLLICVTAMVSLVQFPFSAPIYFCYVAPLVGLAVAAIIFAQPAAPRLLHLCVLIFYLLFAVIWANRGYVFQLGMRYAAYDAETPLSLERAGLRIPRADAEVYESLIAGIREKGGGHEMYAGPDCPEVYFLSGYRNPTRFFVDFQGDLYDRPNEILRLLEEKESSVVVLNRSPSFSRPHSAMFLAAIRERFPHSREIGKFTLFWRAQRPGNPRL
jgi:hypothetical protein